MLATDALANQRVSPMTPRQVRAAVTLSAVCCGVAGVVLLFAPAEVGDALTPGARAEVLLQLLGGALLGFGAMNWTARGLQLGGIYGRAVVAGNQTHLVVGALVLVRHAVSGAGIGAVYGMFTALYVLGAALFVYLAFFSSGLPDR